ncbi:MAG: helix-turn-helix transcriptional regulator, partial [Myxococcota bacterium]
MFDTSRALADMANQIRSCRSADGLTLQQLATRSGVAASTIHKVEARQMVPTVSVLLKIAKGLGCRPEELIRDRFDEESSGSGAENASETASAARSGNGALADGPSTLPPSDVRPTDKAPRSEFGVWKLELSRGHALPPLELDPQQRAIVVVEQGECHLETHGRGGPNEPGASLEVGGGRRGPPPHDPRPT